MSPPAPILLLDASTVTELARRGVDMRGAAWSAQAIVRAPDVLTAIHEEQARAGADVITSNTSRTQRRSLSRIGQARRAREWTLEAARIAREAADRMVQERGDGRVVRVAGSIGPLEDGDDPELAPDEATTRLEHGEHVGYLAEAGVDLLLVERMATIAEARAATSVAAATGLETWTSITTDAAGERLLSGEPLEGWIEAVAPFHPAGLVVCAAPDALKAALPLIVLLAAEIGALPGGAADLGSGMPVADRVDVALDPTAYAEAARGWLDAGVRIVGGSRGATPDHTRALRAVIDERLAAEGEAVAQADPAWRALVARAADMAGGGRALLVGRDPTPGEAILARYSVTTTEPSGLPRLPEDTFRLAIIDSEPVFLPRVVPALERGGWLAARLDGRAGTTLAVDVLHLEGLELREFSLTDGAALVLARRAR